MLKDNQERAKKAASFISIMIIVGVIGTIILIYKFTQSNSVLGMASKSTFERIWDFVVFVLYVLNAVFFIQWFRRAYFNMHVLWPEGRRYSEGMAAGCWWIPVASWFIPYQIMKDMWDQSNEVLTQDQRDRIGFKQVYKQLPVWWGLYIGASITAVLLGFTVGFNTALGNSSMDLTLFVVINVIISIMNIAAGFLLIKIIRKYAEVEVSLAENGTEPFSDFGVPEQSQNWED